MFLTYIMLVGIKIDCKKGSSVLTRFSFMSSDDSAIGKTKLGYLSRLGRGHQGHIGHNYQELHASFVNDH